MFSLQHRGREVESIKKTTTKRRKIRGGAGTDPLPD